MTGIHGRDHMVVAFIWSWSYDSWIYNYLWNQCLSSLKLWVWIPLMERCTWYTNYVIKLC